MLKGIEKEIAVAEACEETMEMLKEHDVTISLVRKKVHVCLPR